MSPFNPYSRRIVCLFLSALLCLTGLSQSGWDLQQCIRYAVNNNISLKQSALNNQLNQNNTSQSKANALPSVNLGAQHTYNFGKTIDRFTNTFANTQVLSQNFFMSSNVVLWSGLSQYNTIRANEFNYLSGVENLKQQENDLALAVADAYIGVIFTDELRKVAEKQQESSTRQLDRTKKLVEAGSIAKSVEYDIRAQLANEQVNLTTAENNYQLALLSLQQLMNLDSVTNFNIVKPEINITGEQLANTNVQFIYESALKSQPGMRSGDYAVLSADKSYAASKGRVSPTISFNASLGTGTSGLAKRITGFNRVTDTLGMYGGLPIVYDRQDPVLEKTPFADQFKDNVNKSLGFTLTVPLFNGLQTYTAVKNAQIGVLNARYAQDLRRQNLYKTIVQAYANAKAALDKYNASKFSVEAAEASFKFAEQKYNAGSMNAFDYNDAKNRLFVAESNLLQAKYDYVFKLKVLDFYQGRPLNL